MKKTTLFILFVLAAMILGVAASASAESRHDYWGPIDAAIGKIEGALDQGKIADAQGYLGELRQAVYRGAAYLIKIGAYDPRVEDIVAFASKAIGANNHDYLLAQAAALNFLIFGESRPVETDSSHS